MQRTHINKPFTLVELMVVIGIMIIILSLSAPAFKKLAMGSSVDIAARMVSSQLMLARAEAISRRECIAVVMPGSNFNKDANDISNYSYTAFRSAIVELDDSNCKFKEWVPGTQWAFLPVGAIIRDVSDSIPSIIKYSSTDGKYERDPSVVSFSAGGSCSSIKEQSSGDMMNGVNNTSNTIRCIIFKPNGRTTKSCFITVKEGLTDDTKDSLVDNCHILEVSQFTGQTRFLELD